jgi:hypothetical protein
MFNLLPFPPAASYLLMTGRSFRIADYHSLAIAAAAAAAAAFPL